MPDFDYTARDLTGRKISGRMTAASRQEVLTSLDEQALFPVEVTDEAPARSAWRSKRVKPQVVATAYGQLADLLRSGVALLRALDVLMRQTSEGTLKEVLSDVHDQVEEGRSLADAMARHPRVFSDVAVSMVRAGGEGGFLEQALEHVADFTEKQQDMKSRTQGALAYPILLASVGTIVVSVLLVFFVPRFETLFTRMRERGELPILTEWLLAFSGMLQNWWLAIVVTVVVLVVALKWRLDTPAGKLWRDRMKLRLPLVSPIFRGLAVARFCRVLGTLLQNGVPILRSLEISSEATGNRVLSDAIREAAENISAGQSLARPLAACRQFPPDVVEMIAVSEEAANLDTVLVQIAESQERRTWRKLDLMVRLIEPLMLLVLALFVLMLAIALLLPVIKASSMI